MKGENMENDFEINEMDLDGEWLRQPALYDMWARLAARAQKERSQIDLQRKILKAKLYKETKERFEMSGKKPTGADLEAEVRTSVEYAELSQALIDAEEKVGQMEAGKWAMVEKSKSLDRLCEDRDKGFFMPGSKASSVRRQEQLKEIDKGLREEMKSKRINRG